MKRAFKWIGHRLEFCLGVLLVALLLPLLALAVVVLRGVLLVAAVVGLAVSAIVYCSSARFRRWVGRLGHPTPRLRVR